MAKELELTKKSTEEAAKDFASSISLAQEEHLENKKVQKDILNPDLLDDLV
jgi:hypothetical protein